MKKNLVRNIAFFVLFILSSVVSAQNEMATNFRGEGKIYVVLAVILLIVAGFFFMLFRLEKKAKQLEKELKETKNESY